MRVVYMGTPEFAVEPLEAIMNSGHEIGYVVTQPDKEKDRGRQLKPTPVKEKAVALGLKVLQPARIKENVDFFNILREYGPDLIVVAAYGKLLPKEILKLPTKGCVNIHASLLPRFRGAAPIQRAIIEGDEYTGITLMYMEEGMDTGDMLGIKKTPIGRKNAGELQDELSILGAELLVESLPAIEAGTIERVKQEEALATYAPMIFKQDGKMDFSQPPEILERMVRGVSPWPGAYAQYKGNVLKIWEAEALNKLNSALFGTITEVSPEGMEISAGGKTLLATVIQMPGKKRMRVSDYLKGNKIEKNIILE